MAEHKQKTQAGRLLGADHGVQVYELSTEVGQGVATVDIITASFSSYGVALRVSRGADWYDGEMRTSSQVVLPHETFLTLLASYRAFERAEKKRLASASSDGSDPFLDYPEDLP